MKLRFLDRMILIPLLGICMLSACTTVDLSQVSLEKSRQTKPLAAVQNVVEKASRSMAALFVSKGWCKDSAANPTQTAASVLLNGKVNNIENDIETVKNMGSRQLSADINLAKNHIAQTTKAAEIFLTTADEFSELDKELSMLEAALLSAKEAETKFGKIIILTANSKNQEELEELKISIGKLKKVTDAYGDRTRGQIASKSNRIRS
ncbi:MAG: hypothetical protein JKX72_05800 [Robiginitomaculum sp.]|nr:hypothetical protein [Robiginitomaculum sp.]